MSMGGIQQGYTASAPVAMVTETVNEGTSRETNDRERNHRNATERQLRSLICAKRSPKSNEAYRCAIFDLARFENDSSDELLRLVLNFVCREHQGHQGNSKRLPQAKTNLGDNITCKLGQRLGLADFASLIISVVCSKLADLPQKLQKIVHFPQFFEKER